MHDSTEPPEAQIIRSWNTNARPWANAVRSGSIISRKLVTDRAIVEAVSNLRPARVFDLGCGEGWLARALSDLGIQVIGVDAVPELIAEATRLGGGEFHVQDYRAIVDIRSRYEPFDAAVCNFSLLGRDSVAALLGAIGGYLAPSGHLLVQTLHPPAACGDHPYRDGWRAGTWLGFGDEFSDPAPWYFRTLESWFSMLRLSGFDVLECREPAAPEAFEPASIIFICRARALQQTDRMEAHR